MFTFLRSKQIYYYLFTIQILKCPKMPVKGRKEVSICQVISQKLFFNKQEPTFNQDLHGSILNTQDWQNYIQIHFTWNQNSEFVKSQLMQFSLDLINLSSICHHFMANRWENNGNSDRLYFGGLQNHCRGDCSHEIKRCLLLGRKVMTNLESILKSRDITLPTKVRLVKALVFLLVSWESLGLQGDPTNSS